MNKWISYSFPDENKKFNITNNRAYFPYPCENSYECSQISILLKSGKYRFELWGAQGGYSRYLNNESLRESSGGRGAYVSGNIELKTNKHLFLFIGGKGEDQTGTSQSSACLGGFNGGGKGGVDELDKEVNTTWPESGAGGGATDIRLLNDTSILGLKSRIIVAAGGGGGVSAETLITDGTPGGALRSNCNGDNVLSATQNEGLFGYGQDGYSFVETIGSQNGGSTGGCGGGYYGGFMKNRTEFLKDKIEVGGSGGSSFVSGCHECDAVQYELTDQISHSGQPIHYSGLLFQNINMKSGQENIPKPIDGSDTEIGHQGNGAIVITYLGSIDFNTCKSTKIYRLCINLLTIIFL